MLVFSTKKFLNHKVSGNKITLPHNMLEAIKEWDGKKVHQYAKNSVKRTVFGETHYIYVGSEKISVGEEFCVWTEKTKSQA